MRPGPGHRPNLEESDTAMHHTGTRHERAARPLLGVVAAACLALCAWPSAGRGTAPAGDLTAISLEDLLHAEVISAARSPRPLPDTPAAVFVLTRDDILRSGAETLPEALRAVPGLQVARIDANKWAVSARGFNGRFANKLLVLVDGRTVYTPLFSGVYWEVQDIPLDDIDRVEVVRGPGAALWGGNAVNGVINIITRRASETPGTRIALRSGTETSGLDMRQGGALGPTAEWRLSARYSDTGEGVNRQGDPAFDGWTILQLGGRLDWHPARAGEVTLQGDVYGGEAGQTYRVAVPPPAFIRLQDDQVSLSGGNILCRWRTGREDGPGTVLQAYFDRIERHDLLTGERRHTLDIDFQHRSFAGARHDVVWGLGYRYTRDRLDDSAVVSFDPDAEDDNLLSGFIQDRITLLPDRLFLVLGAKVERNDVTDFEFQPNARILWRPEPRAALWAAVSRAARTPSRAERTVRYDSAWLPAGALGPGTPPALVALVGNPDYDSERLTAWEAGARYAPAPMLALDAAVFLNRYH
ncbi:TonB-dependent receptor, partial [Dissulfurirhabdus thermomarina]